jgi:opacity protein-like surface antigen
MKKILLTTVAVAAFAQGASALEAGKMYARGDLGYQINKYSDVKLKGFAADIGFGYALSDSVRTDVTLNFSKP